MKLKSIIVDNQYGRNISRISLYGNEISSSETTSLLSEHFDVNRDNTSKEFIQSKIENVVPEKSQIIYLNQLVKQLHDKYYIYFTYDKNFYVVWKDKTKTEKYNSL